MEELLANGKLKVVFATDTLALGINVPARSAVVGEMTKFDGQSRRLLTSGEYRQLTGALAGAEWTTVGYSVLLFSPWVGWIARWRSRRARSLRWRAPSAPATARC